MAYPIQANVLLLCMLTLAACGNAAVPDPQHDGGAAKDGGPSIPDAMPVDACVCREGDLRQRFGAVSFGVEIYDGKGAITECSNRDGQIAVDGELLGGGCALEDGPNEYRARLVMMGPWWGDIFPADGAEQPAHLGWAGSWRVEARDPGHRIISTAACLLPPEEGAACQRELWASYSIETALVASQTIHEMRISCPEGVLMGGGCAVHPLSDDDVKLLRAGFAPDNRDAWLCSWANDHATVQAEVMSAAFCLHESPLPAECGCCSSLVDSIVIKQADAPLRFGANRLEVRCDAGQFLVQGNCTIDVEDISTMADVTMFRDGFPPTPEAPDGDRTRWGCSWYNPTGMTPRAIATAVCLPTD